MAIIERLWRTLRDMLRLRARRAWTRTDIASRLDRGLFYYAFHKRHQGLSGRTPSEVYFGLNPAYTHPKRALREFEMTDKQKSDELLSEVAYLDPEHLLSRFAAFEESCVDRTSLPKSPRSGNEGTAQRVFAFKPISILSLIRTPLPRRREPDFSPRAASTADFSSKKPQSIPIVLAQL